ncbi:MAG: hypothetical protein AAF802_16310 [Planctomycetota bacterium]
MVRLKSTHRICDSMRELKSRFAHSVHRKSGPTPCDRGIPG